MPENVPKVSRLEDAYREAARRMIQREADFEIDDDAEVSLGSSPGAYVEIWLWVPVEETTYGTQTH